MYLRLALPAGILALLIGARRRGENTLTIELALLRDSVPVDPTGERDGRRRGIDRWASNCGEVLRIEDYSLGSGCGVVVERGTIRHTENGLTNLVGFPVRVYGLSNTNTSVMVVARAIAEFGALDMPTQERIFEVCRALDLCFC